MNIMTVLYFPIIFLAFVTGFCLAAVIFSAI